MILLKEYFSEILWNFETLDHSGLLSDYSLSNVIPICATGK